MGYLNAGIHLGRHGPDTTSESGARMSFFESMNEPEMRELFRFWLQRRYGGITPQWYSITPADICPKLLPSLFLYRREPDGRFRCKLIGTELCRVFGANETGRYLDAMLPPQVARHRTGLFQNVLDTALPVYFRGLSVTRPGELRSYSRLLLPLASEGRMADLVFGLALFGPLEALATGAELEQISANPARVLYATAADLLVPATDALIRAGEATA